MKVDVNYLIVDRYKGEKASIMCSCEDNNRKYNVRAIDYSLLPHILGESINDSIEESISDFPAVTNVIFFNLNKYYNTVKQNNKLPEYIFSNNHNKSFRLETVLQDYVILTDYKALISSIFMPRWLCFNPAKNISDKMDLYTPDDGENKFYYRNIKKLIELKWNIGKNCYIQLDPLISSSTESIRQHFKGNIALASNSMLMVNGNVFFENLQLNGCLTVNKIKEGRVDLSNLVIKNNGIKNCTKQNGLFKTKIVKVSNTILIFGKGNYSINKIF